MAHPLVTQIRFCRMEFRRAFDGITDEEAVRRIEPINAMSWMIAHLAWQEQLYWLTRAQGQMLVPELNDLAANGGPPSTPPLAFAWAAWEQVTQAADPYLDGLTSADLTQHMIINGRPHRESTGTMMYRMAYHYYYHIGEAQAVRQLMGHQGVGNFVGPIHDHAPYTPE